jgi:hypothetical protein
MMFKLRVRNREERRDRAIRRVGTKIKWSAGRRGRDAAHDSSPRRQRASRGEGEARARQKTLPIKTPADGGYATPSGVTFHLVKSYFRKTFDTFPIATAPQPPPGLRRLTTRRAVGTDD